MTMTAIVHALYIIGQLFAIMGVAFALPLLVCDGCKHWYRCRCARRQLGSHSDVVGSGE